MKLQKILSRFQKLHKREIDLSLDRIKSLCQKLGNPQDKMKTISVVGTNGKFSTIAVMHSILKEANIKCNVYTSPHILKINERFVFNSQELNDDELAELFEEVEKINNGETATIFEILTACFLYKAAQYPNNINLVESGLFHRFDATNVFKKNLASVCCAISSDHNDWLPENDRTIERIIFEKTSSFLNSNIIVAKQRNKETTECIKKTISTNQSNKYFFNEDFSFSNGENGFWYYEDKFGGLKLSAPNILGEFQLENISTAIATLRTLDLGINDSHIKNGITKIRSIARLQEIKSGKLKNLVKNNKLIVDGSHNEHGSEVLNEYLKSLNCKKHVIIGMMANKEHEKYISYFKDISSYTVIDIPNQLNAINGIDLKNKFNSLSNVKYQDSIEKAIRSIPLEEGDLIIITGSLYLAAEVLSLN
ncbi:bifunctional folylpolyglutamate synthase/dihydrofolate synthase [Candidatus Pelagibacter sp.]|uniref:bifunctional folylpolyglutamate synthase/dihydrofolate synthase n=1 Tax=Candidatus Pelagibacter sp. TaxID=2024849 RepID=UPI003F87A031